MKIEKVCRYVPVVIGTTGNRNQTGGASAIRQMLVSIPRVKWLEGAETDYYHRYTIPNDDPCVHQLAYSDDWCEKIKREPLTERELTVEKLLHSGHTFKQIAEHIGVRPGSVPKYVSRVRIKRAYLDQKA